MPMLYVSEYKNHKMNFDLNALVRKNVLELEEYRSTRADLGDGIRVLLDANENPFGSPYTKWYNRYPDPYHSALRNKISSIKNIPADNIMVGNGSDECIDLLLRVFCQPSKDNIVIFSPSFEMYKLYARLNDVEVREVPLSEDFQLMPEALEKAVDENTKIIFVCSPNSPSGNNIDREMIESLIVNFTGIVVVDEAYINFSRNRSFVPEIKDNPNLVVLQTFSKAWGLAGLRVGMAMASVEITRLLNKIRPPFNVNTISQEIVVTAIDALQDVNAMIMETIEQRQWLSDQLEQVPVVEKVYPSDANFLLVRFNDANAIYEYLKQNGILVSNKSKTKGCEGCLRIAVGTERENKLLTEALKAFNL
jgi:histidinol-phosphate aminotransferase